MAREPRLDLPEIAQHIVQRGHNGLPCFFDDLDRERYLELLRQALNRTGCRLHAYVLMDNHVHLLLTPPGAGATSRLMHWQGRQYVGHFNARYQRSGTLWEGRFKSCLVEDGPHILRLHRYIDLHPVRAGLLARPCEYAWSSCAALVGRRDEPWLTPHPSYLALGALASERAARYRKLLRRPLSERQLAEIGAYLRQQRALGGSKFRALIERRTGRFADIRPPHRPRKRVASEARR